MHNIVDDALARGGTCTGEHGIGLGKIDALVQEHGDLIPLMQAIKASFDPNGILNPGKVLPTAAARAPERGRYRLGVDIGGTFTDVVLLGDDGSVRTAKVLSTPDDYARGVVEGAVALLADCGVTGGRDRRRRPRLHGRLEHGARGPRRADGARDDEGLPRRARDAPPADPGALRHPVPEPAAARSPPAPVRGHRAARPARRDLDGARRGDRPRGRGADPPGRCRGRRDRAAPLVRRRRARAARRGDRPRGRRRRRLRDPLVGDPARDPRVRAHEHGRRQRLRRAGDHALPRLARRPPARGRHRRPARGDAVERRHAHARDGAAQAGAPRRVRPGGRRDGLQLPRPPHRPPPPDLARHGRHHRQGGDRRGRRAGAHERVRGRRRHQPLEQARQGRRPPDQAPLHRRLRDRRGRRQHRRDRRARQRHRRAAQRRLGSGAGVLRARRRGSDADRRAARARLPQRRRSSAAARSRSTRRARARRSTASSRRRSAARSRRRPTGS